MGKAARWWYGYCLLENEFRIIQTSAPQSNPALALLSMEPVLVLFFGARTPPLPSPICKQTGEGTHDLLPLFAKQIGGEASALGMINV